MPDKAELPEGLGREKFRALVARAQKQKPVSTAVVHPCDDVSLRGAIEAAQLRLIVPILVGPTVRIRETARQAGLDLQRFADLCLDISGEKTQAHMAASRTLLNRLGGHGFPTFALQSGADRFAVLDVGPFLGDAAAWQESLARAVAQAGGRIEAGRPDSAGGPVCDAQGCALPARG